MIVTVRERRIFLGIGSSDLSLQISIPLPGACCFALIAYCDRAAHFLGEALFL